MTAGGYLPVVHARDTARIAATTGSGDLKRRMPVKAWTMPGGLTPRS